MELVLTIEPMWVTSNAQGYAGWVISIMSLLDMLNISREHLQVGCCANDSYVDRFMYT